MTRIIKQLLDFSRRRVIEKQSVNPSELVTHCARVLEPIAKKRGVSIAVECEEHSIIAADPMLLEQVLVNLIVNAIDAMPNGGVVRVRGRRTGPFVAIEVCDERAGIPADDLGHVFEPFFTTKEVGKGTGLGLSTVYGIIKQTGGFVYVDSVLHQGTTFRIFLPRHIPGAAELAEQAAELEAPAITDTLVAADQVKRAAGATAPAKAASVDLTGQGTILLVEDEEGLRALNARGLASRGYTVLEAGNGVEAIDVLEKSGKPIDLVVSDVVMPEMDGPTLARELRTRNPDLKIIFVSGYAEDAFQKNLPEHGQFAFLPKPFTLSQLVAAVKETMRPPGQAAG